MSIRALLLGVESRLKTLLSDANGQKVGVQPDGRPPPAAGQIYVAVHAGGNAGDNDTPEGDDDRRYDAHVTVTFKFGYSPRDRVGSQTLQEGTAYFLDLVDSIPLWLVGKWDVVAAANAAITGFNSTTNGFVEPFQSSSTTEPAAKGAEWLFGDVPESAPSVWAATITLRGARRIRVQS